MSNPQNPIIVLVYASWCGHCEQLKPEWEKMKLSVSSALNIIEIEESEKEQLEKYKQMNPSLVINGYPTIFKIHSNGHVEYFNGERDAANLKKWVTSKHATFRKKTRGVKTRGGRRRLTRKYRKSTKRQQK